MSTVACTSTSSLSTPEVSVVVRSYNRGERLLRAIDSVLAQTFQDFELVVVDDGSEDGSAEEVRRRYADLPQLRLIALQVNQGAAAAANIGVGEARGRYVAFLDSDDEWLPLFLECHLGALKETPRAVLSYCDYYRAFGEFSLEQPIRCWPSQEPRREFLQGGFIHSMSLTVVLRDAIISVGGFDDEYSVSHDFDLWLRLALAVRDPFVHVPVPLARYRISVDGVTSDTQRWHEEYEDALERGFRHPAAEQYRAEHAKARERISLGIVARRQCARWVREPAQRSVSVVLVTPVGSTGLLRALDSVLDQQGVELDVVVVCDDPEQEQRLMEVDARDDVRVRIARFDARRSPGRLINAGIQAATGELVAFLDADDCWLPEYLACHLRAHSVLMPAPVFSVCDWTVNGGPEAPPCAFWPSRSSDLMAHALTSEFPGPLSALVVTRHRLMQVGRADETLAVGVERDLQLRLLAQIDRRDSAAAVTAPPVRITRSLVGCCMSAARLRAREELARVHPQEPFRGFWNTPAGRDYVFLRNEAIARFIERGY